MMSFTKEKTFLQYEWDNCSEKGYVSYFRNLQAQLAHDFVLENVIVSHMGKKCHPDSMNNGIFKPQW